MITAMGINQAVGQQVPRGLGTAVESRIESQTLRGRWTQGYKIPPKCSKVEFPEGCFGVNSFLQGRS